MYYFRRNSTSSNLMFKSFKVIVSLCLAILLLHCQAPVDPDKSDSSAGSYYKDLASVNPDSLSYDQLYDRALGLWDVVFEEKDCDTEFGKGHVIIAGPEDGPPLVLLHGMHASSTSWYPNIAAMAETHRVYAIDFILEVNKSKMTKELNGTADVLKWYDEVFECLGLEKFDIVGASRGGWLGAQIAIKSPERVKNLVLLSPAQTFIWIPPSKKMLTNMMYTFSPSRDDLREALEALSNNVENIDQLYIDHYFRATTKAEIDASIFEMTPLSSKELGALNMPVLVLIGDDDFANNKSSLKKAEKEMPNVKTAVLENAGHFVSIDQAEKVNAEIIDFLGNPKP